MAQNIQLSQAPCDDCFAVCWFAYDDSTGQTKHIDDFTAYRQVLEAQGFYYAGYSAGVMTYKKARKSAPLAVDWQILLEAHEAREYIDIQQDW
jgi:hypothetical protein